MMHRNIVRLEWMALVVVALILQGSPSGTGQTSATPAEIVPVEMKSFMAVFCMIGENRWRRVLDQNESGVLIAGEDLSFSQVWDVDFTVKATPGDAQEHKKWTELLIPLPSEDIPCIGYALTYPRHQQEVSLEEILSFKKNAIPKRAQDDIVYRKYLDYEAEIGVLVHRGRMDRFGYLVVNDLTDRGIQVRTFDGDNMGPGFSLAKSFEGALRVGPLIAVGNEASWYTLQVDLFLNGAVRQQLRASECLIHPRNLVDKHFEDKTGSPWLLVATGTTDGVLFQPPDLWEKAILFVGTGFSMEEAGEDWLDHLRFLQPGDEIKLLSPVLGQAWSRVIKGELQ